MHDGLQCDWVWYPIASVVLNHGPSSGYYTSLLSSAGTSAAYSTGAESQRSSCISGQVSNVRCSVDAILRPSAVGLHVSPCLGTRAALPRCIKKLNLPTFILSCSDGYCHIWVHVAHAFLMPLSTANPLVALERERNQVEAFVQVWTSWASERKITGTDESRRVPDWPVPAQQSIEWLRVL